MGIFGVLLYKGRVLRSASPLWTPHFVRKNAVRPQEAASIFDTAQHMHDVMPPLGTTCTTDCVTTTYASDRRLHHAFRKIKRVETQHPAELGAVTQHAFKATRLRRQQENPVDCFPLSIGVRDVGAGRAQLHNAPRSSVDRERWRRSGRRHGMSATCSPTSLADAYA